MADTKPAPERPMITDDRPNKPRNESDGPKMGRGTVAPGRTVVHVPPKGQPEEGIEKLYGPGEEVEMHEADIVRLRKIGHLVTPQGDVVVADIQGPKVLGQQ